MAAPQTAPDGPTEVIAGIPGRSYNPFRLGFLGALQRLVTAVAGRPWVDSSSMLVEAMEQGTIIAARHVS